MGPETGFSPTELEAITSFLRRCAVPLVREEDDRLALLGTGSFFSFLGKLWLVTAAHCIRSPDDLRELAIPTRSARGFLTLGNCCLVKPSNSAIDVAVVLLGDNELAMCATQNWQILDESNIWPANASTSRFVVAGYPQEILAKTQLVWANAFTQIYTGPYSGPTASSHPQLLLTYTRTAPGPLGDGSTTPDLSGLSGAGVWAVVDRPDGLWAPERVLQLAGVQSSFKHSAYIRAELWQAVLEVIRRWSVEESAPSKQ
jgi:hypothetical protein